MDPLGDALPEILGVGVQIYNARLLERSKRLNRRLELHLIIGGSGVSTGYLFVLTLEPENRAPPSWPRVSGARSVGVDLNSFSR